MVGWEIPRKWDGFGDEVEEEGGWVGAAGKRSLKQQWSQKMTFLGQQDMMNHPFIPKIYQFVWGIGYY